MDSLSELESKLLVAQARLKKATDALAPKHQGGEWEEYWAAHDELVKLEREVASMKGETHAIPANFPIKWDTGAPLPHVLISDYMTLLTFLISEVSPDWDGTTVTVKSPNDQMPQALALVEFSGCITAKLGSPNDEVFHGHSLHGKGQEPYTAQIVVNSPWIKEIEENNKVHRHYNSESWRTLKHYIFWFHDTTFECIARSFSVQVYNESVEQMLKRMCSRLLDL